jgi:histidinol-phosphate aminotransferase
MSTQNITNGRPGPYYWLANPCILPIHPYKPGKQIAEVKKELGLDSIVKLASNENPAGPSLLALLALESALRDINFYPEDGGIELKRALADKCGISSNNIILGHGATEVLEIIVRTFVCPSDEVISAHPSFPWFQMLGQMSGAKNVIVPLREHTHDLKAMAESITAKTVEQPGSIHTLRDVPGHLDEYNRFSRARAHFGRAPPAPD